MIDDTDISVNWLTSTFMLRPYQEHGKQEIYRHWSEGRRRVLAVYPTGAGKTVLYANIVAEYKGASCVSAHRAELVSQTCIALAREGVRHGIMAPKEVIKSIVALEIDRVGRNYYDPNARCRVAGVDTLVNLSPNDPWAQQVGLVVQDEAHHVLKVNKWGKSIALFPNAYALGVTATPLRADGKGLGLHADGLFEAMVIGPTMRQLINEKFLTPYRIFAPPSDIDLTGVRVTDSGDYSPEPLRKAVHKSKRLVGDVVEHYKRHAAGKLGVTFAVDIEGAMRIAEAFRAAGVPAEVVTGKTPIALRNQILRRFERREILQLVNCDIFGEGFDLPALEVVSFARPTMSYGLYCQQFGRVLRIMEGKEFGIVIDHVGNVEEHKLPDRARQWSLNRRERRSANAPLDAIPMMTCIKCTFSYERSELCCPIERGGCGHTPVPGGRSLPLEVDGDLVELSPEVLARMRGDIEIADAMPMISPYLDPAAQGAQKKFYHERMAEQARLREAMMIWGGGRHVGNERMRQKEFYLRFGIDVWSAMTLKRAEAETLRQRIEASL